MRQQRPGIPRTVGPAVPPTGVAAARSTTGLVKIIVSLAVTVTLLIAVLPKAAGAPWADITGVLGQLPLLDLVGLAALWLLGLYAYTFVLTGALPGLTHRRALTLNLTGSAVANLVPFGGALGVGLNYSMSRRWGFSKQAFALYTLVSNLWVVLAKLSLPALAIGVLVLTDNVAHPRLSAAAFAAMCALIAVVATVVALLASERTAARLGRGAERVADAVLRLARRTRTVHLEQGAVAMRRESIKVLRGAWPQLSLGMLTYSALQALLLWSCLHLLGSTLSPAQVFAGYALERVLTMVIVTPGGAGLVEVGMAALLVAFGGAPAVTAAGILLYRAFTFGIEVPIGGTGLLVWFWRRRRERRWTLPSPVRVLDEAA
ncbi:MAG: putative heme transporter [Actinomycetota bacterium]|nr:putative heme transporter [Actinomycetota bacterium]